jgi:FKBP-type peptidyl-prolyl cis-trans isomerase FklB
MKQLFFGTLFLLLISACGAEDEQAKPLKFKSSKDELSYVLGAINAKTIVSSGETSFANLDKDELIKGFNENLNATPADDCLPELQKLFGPTYQDFNKKFVKSGSRCMGKMTGHAFYSDIKKLGGLPLVNLAMVKKGYADGLFLRDTVMKEAQMRQIMQDFMISLNEKVGMKMLDKAKKLPGATVFDNGIIMLTIKEGKGAYPNPTDDVKVQYVLMSAIGDTIQNSYTMKNQEGKIEPVPLQLDGGVIPGWSYALPKMKKGGKYKIYIPWELAYGIEGGKESLCFDIELIDSAPAGTFVKPQMR